MAADIFFDGDAAYWNALGRTSGHQTNIAIAEARCLHGKRYCPIEETMFPEE